MILTYKLYARITDYMQTHPYYCMPVYVVPVTFRRFVSSRHVVLRPQVLTTTIISLSSIGIVGACTAFCFMALRNLSRYSIEGDMYVEYQFIPVGFVFVFAYVVVYR